MRTMSAGKTLLIAMNAQKRYLSVTKGISLSSMLTMISAKDALSHSKMLKLKMILAKKAAKIIIKN